MSTIINSYQAGALTNHVVLWIDTIRQNGGALPSQKTIVAVNHFSQTLNETGLSSKMLNINPFVPDSLVAARTPLISTVGNRIWGGSSPPDLTIDGLKRTDTTQYLDVGINPATYFVGSLSASAGMTMYVSTGGLETCRDIGCTDGTYTNAFILYTPFADAQGYWDCWSNRVNAAVASPYRGYYSGNRTSVTSTAHYRGTTADGHTTLASNNVTAINAQPPNYNIYVFGANSAGTSYAFGTAKRFSFAGIHKGLTFSESSTFFNAIYQLRREIGGGFVT